MKGKEKKGVVLDMARIPVRFGRVAAAFDADMARVRLCESSGSEHSAESSTDLSDLVKSFMERAGEGEEEEVAHHEKDHEEVLENSECSDSEKREILQGLFAGSEGGDEGERNAREKIRGEVELACVPAGDSSLPEFKRRLMTRLREKGFDAGEYMILVLIIVC